MNRLLAARPALRRAFASGRHGLEARASDKKPVDWGLLKRVVWLDKRGTAVVFLVTWTHTAIYMAIPYFFAEMQRLANLRLQPAEELAAESRDPGAGLPAPQAAQPPNTDSLPRSIGRKLKDMALRRPEAQAPGPGPAQPLSREALDGEFVTFGATLVLVNVLAGALGYLKHTRSKRLENSLAMALKRALYRDLVAKKYDRFLNKSLSATEIAVKLNSNVSQFAFGLADNLASFVRATLFTSAGSALLFYQLPGFSAMTLALFAGLSLSASVFNSLLFESSRQQTEASNKVASYIGDQASNIQSLKTLGLQQRSLQTLEKVLGVHHKKVLHVASIWGANIAVLETVGIGGLLLVLLEGCYQIATGQIAPELIWAVLNTIFVVTGLRGIVNSVTSLKNKLGTLADTLAMTGNDQLEVHDSLDKILGFGRPSRESQVIEDVQSYFSSTQPQAYQPLLDELSVDSEVQRVEQLVAQQQHPKTFDVKFENVSFRYSEDSDFIFKNLTCEFVGGKIHGLVSPSGFGKTTFLNLAIGLLQPTSGRVLVNGLDINDPAYDMHEFLSHTAYVTQHTQLFMDSLLVNILLGNQKLLLLLVALADEHKLDKLLVAKYVAFKCLSALKHAQALDFVASQEKGLNTEIGERGLGLSGGQLQRIVLARTIFRNPSLLLMDEATSALDKSSEHEVVSYLKEFLPGKTAFVITHNQKEYERLIEERHNLRDLTKTTRHS